MAFISSATIKEQGRTAYYKMLESARDGELIQVRRGVYASIDQLSGNMIDIDAIVPDGILCLWSAWSIYGLYATGISHRHQKRQKGYITVFP